MEHKLVARGWLYARMTDESRTDLLDGAGTHQVETGDLSHGETGTPATSCASSFATHDSEHESESGAKATEGRKDDDERLVHEHIRKLKREKVQAKTKFTSERRAVIVAARERTDVDTSKLDDITEEVQQLLASLACCYKSIGDVSSEQKTTEEMEEVQQEHKQAVVATTKPRTHEGQNRMRTRSQASNSTSTKSTCTTTSTGAQSHSVQRPSRSSTSESNAPASRNNGGTQHVRDSDEWIYDKDDESARGWIHSDEIDEHAESGWLFNDESASGDMRWPGDAQGDRHVRFQTEVDPWDSPAWPSRVETSSLSTTAPERSLGPRVQAAEYRTVRAPGLAATNAADVDLRARVARQANESSSTFGNHAAQAALPDTFAALHLSNAGENTAASDLGSTPSRSAPHQSVRPQTVGREPQDAHRSREHSATAWSTEPQTPRSETGTRRSQAFDTWGANVSTTTASSGLSGRPLGAWAGVKRLEIPVFTGDKARFAEWKAAFIACVDSAPATPEYKFLQMRQFLGGEALKVVASLGYSSRGYSAAKARLERRYGGQRRQIALYLEQLEQLPPIRAGNASEMQQYADLLDVAVINLQDAGQQAELGAGSFYTMLLKKLPESLLPHYYRWMVEHHYRPSVITLLEWVTLEAEYRTIAFETRSGLTRTSQQRNLAVRQSRGETKPTTGVSHRTFVASDVSHTPSKAACAACKESHATWTCKEFRKLDINQRWVLAKREKLCYRCLGQGHRGSECRRTKVCGSDGCKDTHHWLLHTPARAAASGTKTESGNHPPSNSLEISLDKSPGSKPVTMFTNRSVQDSPVVDDDSMETPKVAGVTEGEQPIVSFTTSGRGKVNNLALRTIPVLVQGRDRELEINALLDDGSTTTYISSKVASELGLSGMEVPVTVTVLNGAERTFLSMPVEFELSSLDRQTVLPVTAHTTNAKVVGGLKATDWSKAAKQWRHLQCVRFPALKSEDVDMLIGLDQVELHASEAEVKGRDGEPVARLTPLGWTCVGSIDPQAVCQPSTSASLFTFSTHEQITCDTNLEGLVRKFWEVDQVPACESHMSKDEQTALDTVSRSLHYTENRYEVSVPWKVEPATQNLPNTYSTAFKRLQQAERTLLRKPPNATAYSKVIQTYLEKGYVGKVPQEQCSGPAWYLPHFAVIRQDKATTKLRIVFDASARTDGLALNDLIHTGPKLQRDLFNVLTRFRREPVAVVCDIAEMYLQIELAPQDRPYHRFLWRDFQDSEQPTVYQFNRVVFGVNASPFLAQYVAQENARRLEHKYPMAATAVDESTYMDDSMPSVPNEQDGKELVQQLSELWAAAGMHARKWLSNSPDVLKQVPQEDRVQQLDLDAPDLPSIKTLGMWWDAESDSFSFRFNQPASEAIVTKRFFLRKLASIFDPLGLLAPFTVRAKTLFQELWLQGYDWDDPLAANMYQPAVHWFEELPTLAKIQVPRCLRLDSAEQIKATVVHVFADASEKAYGAAVYVHHRYNSDAVTCRLVASRLRVAPLATQSVPRLELMAAVIGLNLAASISKTLKVDSGDIVYWSDSSDVLHWVHNTSRRFKPFVAHRVGEIQAHSAPSQWHYVPTAVNPADLLTRGKSAEELVSCQSWWGGPDYLQSEQSEWPASVYPCKGTPAGEVEKKAAARAQVFMTTEAPLTNRLSPDCYSKFQHCVRVRAWVLRFRINCSRPPSERQGGPLLQTEV